MLVTKKLIVCLFISLLVACGGGGNSSDGERKDDDKTPTDIIKGKFSPPNYQPIALTSENAETVVSEIIAHLGVVIGDMAYILIDKTPIDRSDYTNELNQNITFDLSEDRCKSGGELKVKMLGDVLLRQDSLALLKPGYSETATHDECFAYTDERFKNYYYNGVSTVHVEQGLVDLFTHAAYDINWADTPSKARLVMDERIYVNGLDGSVIMYNSGEISYEMPSQKSISIKHSEFYVRDQSAEHYLNNTHFTLSQTDTFKYQITELSTGGFFIGAGSSNGLFSVNADTPFEVSEFSRSDLDAGSFTIESKQGVIKVQLHKDHYTYSLDSDDDGDFEVTETINL